MAKETKYIVSDKGYLLKGSKVYKTGETISLTDAERKNVGDKVVTVSSDEGKALAKQSEERTQETTQEKDTQEKDTQDPADQNDNDSK